MQVLNMGSLNLDYVYQVPHIVRPKETLASSDMQVYLGGKGFNQSVALAKAGVPVFHAGLIGEDGAVFLQTCAQSGIDARHIHTVPGKSGHTIIQVDSRGENCILLHGGSNQMLDKAYIDGVLESFEAGDFLLLQNEVNLLDYIIDKAWERKLRIILNPSPFDEKIPRCHLEKVSYFLLNEVEGEQFTQEKEPERILDAILARYPGAGVVLTIGKDGSIFAQAGQRVRQEAISVGEAVDTTAAGDTFTGYFVAGLMEGLPMEENLKRCALAAGIAVSRKGASPSIPARSEVDAWLA